MNEGIKTLVFFGIAAVVALVAWATRPTPTKVKLPEMVGKDLFESFDDPTEAASLEIVRYDEELGEVHKFKVARNSQTGVWSIPSHSESSSSKSDSESRAKRMSTEAPWSNAARVQRFQNCHSQDVSWGNADGLT